MGVVMQGGGTQPTVCYQRIKLTGLYLRCARKSAQRAVEIADIPEQREECLEHTIQTILWSVLSLEAGVNEFAEDVIAVSDLEDFDQCRKRFHKPKNISKTIWKWHLLFKLGPKQDVPLTDPILHKAEMLVQTRHHLAHYRPQETSRKLHFHPGPAEPQEDGKVFQVMWHAGMVPTTIEPALVEQELLGDKPKQHFLAARDVFLQWELNNGGDGSSLAEAIPGL